MVIGVDASRAARPLRTGTENYAFYLIRALLALDADHRYRLYFDRSLPISPPHLFPPGHWEARVIPFPRLWTHLRLSWEVSWHPPELLFVPAHVLPLLHPRRSVVTVHDLGFRIFPQAHRPFDRWYLEWSTRYHVRTAAHLLADSEATKADLIAAHHIPSRRVTVVYPGRNESLRRVEDPAAIGVTKTRYGIHGDYILYLGTLHPRKNLSRLVEAFALFRQEAGLRASRWKLVLAGGKGWRYESLFHRVADLGLADEVIFTGYIAQDDLAPLLSGARCFAFPSLYEGFGFPVLEAMACGTPVICSDTSSLPEVAGEAALLVDPTDTEAWAGGLHQLLTDAELECSLVQRGYHRAQAFSWERAARQVLRVFAEVLDG
jgi:glycosyltransferase involved in cell wall biosynthesis